MLLFNNLSVNIARNTDVWNRHKESKNTKLYEIVSGTKLYYLWVKSFSTWGERDTIFLCWLLLHRQLSTQPTRGARSAQRRLASPSSESQPSSSEAGPQLTDFSQISAHASGAWRYPYTLVPITIWNFYFDLSEWHIRSACAWTPALMLHLTNPCAKRKVLTLTKPKGKIYKTKSLRHYITFLQGIALSLNLNATPVKLSAANGKHTEGFDPAVVDIEIPGLDRWSNIQWVCFIFDANDMSSNTHAHTHTRTHVSTQTLWETIFPSNASLLLLCYSWWRYVEGIKQK